MLGAIAQGTTVISGLLRGDDVKRTIHALQSCDVKIAEQHDCLVIEGVGLYGLQAPKSALYLGNSGTSMRLLTGIFAGQQFVTRCTGDASLSARPMRRVVDPLRSMGADISLSDDNTPPVLIRPVNELNSIEWVSTVASAQVHSAILLAALYAEGQTYILEPKPTRNHTENMLKSFGCQVDRVQNLLSIRGKLDLNGQQLDIPADFSSAAFFIVAALVTPESEILLEKVGVNETRTGLLVALRMMGAKIRFENERMIGRERVADLRVYAEDRLHGIDLPVSLVSLMIDEMPIMAVAAAVARGTTVIRGCEELRVKESDRIKTITTGLQSLGIAVEELPDGMIIHGGKFSGGRVDSCGDHRIAMACAVAGSIAEEEVEIVNCDCVKTSFPGFASVARQVGMDLRTDSVECLNAS